MPEVTNLILLPGLDGTDVFFRPLLEALPAWIRCTVVTYPNGPDTGYSALVPRVEAATAALKGYFVLGWSFGGPLAVRIAARDPGRVRGLLLCSSFLSNPRPAFLRTFAVAPVIGAVRALRRTRLIHPQNAANGLRKAKAETWRRVGSRALAARARAALAIDVRAELASCRAPILYLAAQDDRVIGSSHGRSVLAAAPHAEMRVIPGPHLALFTTPRPAAQTIEWFVEACSAAFRRSAPAAGC